MVISRVVKLFGFTGECGNGGGLVRLLLATCDNNAVGILHGSSSHRVHIGAPYVGMVKAMRAGVLRRIFEGRFVTGKFLSEFVFVFPGSEGVSE